MLRPIDAFVYAIAIDSVTEQRVSTRVNPEALREITGPSGGYTEVVRSSEDLGPTTERIAEELNAQYTLGVCGNASSGRLRKPQASWWGAPQHLQLVP